MKTIAQKLGLLASSVLVSLFFGEILVRLSIPQQLINLRPDVWRKDSTFGYRHHENVNTTVNFGEGRVHFVTDGNGYRVNPNTLENKTEVDIFILIIGDSFLEALQVEAELAMPEVVRKSLASKYRKSVLVDNTGVGGWDPNHYYLEARSALQKSGMIWG